MSDTGKIEAIVEELENICSVNDYVLELLASIKNLLPHPEHAEGSSLGEWISVEGRLPEYHKGVLVCGGSCGDIQMVAILQNTTRSIAENSPKDDRWFAVPGWGHELKPTMWMPLPAPPMTGEGEGR